MITLVGASDWKNDPESCPNNLDSQTCSGSDLVCGSSGGVTFCYDMSTLNAPGSSATTHATSWSGSYDGGYLIDCEAYDGSEPHCDNGGNLWCDRDSGCYNIGRITQCEANKWSGDAGDTSCTTCRSGYVYCDGSYIDGDGCEVDYGSTSCADGDHNNLDASCICQCDSGYLDCDASGKDTGNGCEVQDNGACTVGSLDGTYDGCTCVVDKSYYQTGTFTEYFIDLVEGSMLWFKNWGDGATINATDENNVTFLVNQSGVYWNDTSLLGGGSGDNESWNESYADTKYANITWNYNQTTGAIIWANDTIQANNVSWLSTYNVSYNTWLGNYSIFTGLINNASYLSTYNATYAGYNSTGLIVNHTLDTYNNWNTVWLSTYNATYLTTVNNASYLSTFNTTYDATTKQWDANFSILFGAVNNVSYLSTYNATYDAFVDTNETTRLDNLNETVVNSNSSWLSTYNATYDNYADNVSRNYTLDTFTNWNTDWLSTYNATYASYNSTGLIVNHTLDVYNNWNTVWLSTYNVTYDAYKTNVSINWTQLAYDLWDTIWTSTYNATYETAINNASYLSTYNATYNKETTISADYREIYLGSNLIGWWRMDEHDATNTYDYLNSRAGEQRGDSNYNSSGKLGGCFEFDGDGDYISIGDTAALNTFGNLSVSFWVKQTATSTNAVPVGQAAALSSKGWMFYQDGSGNLLFAVYNYANDYVDSSQSLPLNTWLHVVGVSNDTDTCIYLNGSLIDCDSKGAGSYVHPSINGLWFGAYGGEDDGFADYFFNGSIDDVMIFNRALTSSEVKGLYFNKYENYDIKADYNFTNNNFNGSGNFTTTGDLTTTGNVSCKDVIVSGSVDGVDIAGMSAFVILNSAHRNDNSQAHSDYLLNDASDTTSGTITAAGFTTTGVIQNNGNSGGVISRGYGGAPNYGGMFLGYRQDTSIGSGNTLFSLRGGGSDGGENLQAAEIRLAAASAWTSTSQATRINIYLTPDGSKVTGSYYNIGTDRFWVREDNLPMNFGIGEDLKLYSDGSNGRIDTTGYLKLNHAFASGTATVTASADNTDVSDVNTLWVTTAGGDVVLGGLTGGIDGQVLYVIRKDTTNDLTLENAAGVGTQDFIMHTGANEIIDAGGVVLVCDGSDWYDVSHAKHV